MEASESMDKEEGGNKQHPKTVTEGSKGKSCKGCLYYSSLQKSNTRNPLCVGVSRTLPQVPGYAIGETELEASKEGRSLSDFKYACVGYSVFLDNKHNSIEGKGKQAELPFCAGIEILVDKSASTPHHSPHVPAHIHNKEDSPVFSQPRAYKPSHSMGAEFWSRFTRNAGLVTSGVVRNMHRMGNYIKDSVDDILYPYRRRPK